MDWIVIHLVNNKMKIGASNYFKSFNIFICLNMQKRKENEDFYTSIFFFDELYRFIKKDEPKIDMNAFKIVEDCYRIMGYVVEYHNGWEMGNLRAFYIVKWKKNSFNH